MLVLGVLVGVLGVLMMVSGAAGGVGGRCYACGWCMNTLRDLTLCYWGGVVNN